MKRERCTRDAHDMLCAVSIIKRQVQGTSCHKSPTPHHLTPICHPERIHVTFICDMPHSYVTCLIYKWHDSFMCDMPHSYVTCLIYMWNASFICDMPHPCVTGLIHMWNDSFIYDITLSYVTCLIHMWNDSFICLMTPSSWHHVSVCDMSSFMSHDSSIYTSLLIFLSTTPPLAHVNTHPEK